MEAPWKKSDYTEVYKIKLGNLSDLPIPISGITAVKDSSVSPSRHVI